MSRTAQTIAMRQPRTQAWVQQGAIAVLASLFVALCARVTLPLPGTPVPLTLQNFGVLVVGLTLGPRRGFAALLVYLMEGAMGMPVFNPAGPGGFLQLLGPTGGFLMAYPFVAALAGWVVLSQKLTLPQVLGVAAVIGASVLVTLRSRADTVQPDPE